MTTSTLERELIVVTGKGGVGKTTVAAALGLLAARRGLATIVVEVGDQRHLPALFAVEGESLPGSETRLAEHLWGTSVDPRGALMEWLGTLGGRISARVLGSSTSFQHFAAAAPGAKELVSMVKVWELTQGQRWGRHANAYDLVILDAPATGHALAMLNSPQTFAAIARVGPIATQAQRVRQLLEDPASCAIVAVAQATEMAVAETVELAEGLRDGLSRELDMAIANAVLPRRFDARELELIGQLDLSDPVLEAAASAARSIHRRANHQHGQVARLRRQRSPDGSPLTVHTVPFAFTTESGVETIEWVAGHLGRRV